MDIADYFIENIQAMFILSKQYDTAGQQMMCFPYLFQVPEYLIDMQSVTVETLQLSFEIELNLLVVLTSCRLLHQTVFDVIKDTA